MVTMVGLIDDIVDAPRTTYFCFNNETRDAGLDMFATTNTNTMSYQAK